MSKRKNYLTIIAILVLVLLAGSLVFGKDIPFVRDDISFRLGLDLQGGAHLVYQADLTEIKPAEHREAMEGLRDVIARRVDLFGVAEPLVQVKNDRLIVELAGVLDVTDAIKMIGETPFLEFKEPRAEEERTKIFAKIEEVREKLGKEIGDTIEMTPENLEKIQQIENWHYVFKNPHLKATELTGKHLERSRVGFRDGVGIREPVIELQFNEEGANLFEEITARNINQRVAIYIDGIQISNPVVNEKITGGEAIISGGFTIEEAKELSRNLNVGALPIPIELISQQTVGPTLGEISLEKSLLAGLFGFLAILIFLVFVYRLPGILAGLALIIYIILLLALFKIIPVTLTLAGIAGVIFSVGLAVDANVLVFSRMKEELRDGKSVKTAIKEGFDKAWPSIRDGNLTTLVVALILFGFGTGFVKGFALTLIIGILISMFSAIVITRSFLKLFEGTRLAEVKWLWG